MLMQGLLLMAMMSLQSTWRTGDTHFPTLPLDFQYLAILLPTVLLIVLSISFLLIQGLFFFD